MKDKELLRKAAKAAGIDHPGGDHCLHGDSLWDCKELRWWNSLDSNSDADFLVEKLNLRVYDFWNWIAVSYPGGEPKEIEEEAREHYTASAREKMKRRAITRAAAAMFK